VSEPTPPPGGPPTGPPGPPPGPAGAPPPFPSPPSAERVRLAYQSRNQSDYVFNFWTALGWSILSCGFYSFYVLYQLMRRSRDHNRRRLELLDGATAFAWEKAQTAGVAEELRPNFERTSTFLGGLRQLTTEFRDPVIWMVIAIAANLTLSFGSTFGDNNQWRAGTGGLGSIVWIVIFILLNGDLVRHDYNEGGAESELATIYGRLGAPVPPPDPGRLQQKHNVVGRVVATIFSCGIYGLWWGADTMREGNQHFEKNWAWEDSLAQAVQRLQAA
jgi:hypothetical protein